jgi:hypothetical protein
MIEIPEIPSPGGSRGASRAASPRLLPGAAPASFVSTSPAPDQTTDQTQPQDDPPELDSPAPSDPELAFRPPVVPDEAGDSQIASLFINPFHTTGIDLDQQPGDDALRVLFEPRNQSGQFVPRSAAVTVVLIDPSLEGDAARVARWELSPREVGEGILEARPQRGVRLELPWPAARPASSKLKLFVRYTDADGRQMEGSSDVAITLPGQVSQRWTPRTELGSE